MRSLKNSNFEVSSWTRNEIYVSPTQSDYARKLVELHKLATECFLNIKLKNKINGDFGNVIRKTSRVLNECVKFDFTDASLMLAKRLMKYYPYKGNKENSKKYTHYKQLVESLESTHIAETKAELLLTEIDNSIVSKLSNEVILEKLSQSINDIDQILHDHNSIDFILNAYKLKLRKAQITNDYEETVSLCEEAMSRLSKKSYSLPHICYVNFVHPLIPLHIQQNNFQEADKKVDLLLSKINGWPNNKHAIYSYGIISKMRQLNFDKALENIDSAIKADKEELYPRYRIYEGYCSLFSNRRFKLGKFFNSVFELNKDREGYRVNIIILQLIHLLKRKRYGEFIEKVEAVEFYMYRFVKSKSDRLKRSRLFLEMLLMTHKCNFNSIAFKRKTEKQYSKLLQTPSQGASQVLEQEPISFEFLYHEVVKMLK